MYPAVREQRDTNGMRKMALARGINMLTTITIAPRAGLLRRRSGRKPG